MLSNIKHILILGLLLFLSINLYSQKRIIIDDLYIGRNKISNVAKDTIDPADTLSLATPRAVGASEIWQYLTRDSILVTMKGGRAALDGSGNIYPIGGTPIDSAITRGNPGPVTIPDGSILAFNPAQTYDSLNTVSFNGNIWRLDTSIITATIPIENYPGTWNRWIPISTSNPTSGSGNEFEIPFFDNTTTNLDTDTGLKYQDDTLKTQKFKINDIPIVDNSGNINISGGLELSTATNPHGGSNEIGDQIDSLNIIEVRNINAIASTIPKLGDKISYKNSNYLVEDTTYILTSDGGIRSYGSSDNVTRVQTANGKYAHLKGHNGKVNISAFIDAYSNYPAFPRNANDVSLYDDTEALQAAVDYVSTRTDLSSVFIDVSALTITDTIVVTPGCIIEGQYYGGRAHQQMELLKGTIFLNLNDSSKDAIKFTRYDGAFLYGGYASRLGIKNLSIATISPARSAIVLAEVENPIAERFFIFGDDFNSDERKLTYGLITYGLVSSFISDFGIRNCSYYAISLDEHFYGQTTSRIRNAYISECGNGVNTVNGGFVWYNTIIEQVDTAAFRGRAFTAYDLYLENMPSNNNHGQSAIQVTRSSSKLSITGGVLGSNYINNPAFDYYIIDADSVDAITLTNFRLGGTADYIVKTTDYVRSLKFQDIYGGFSEKSPITGDYTGIDERTKVTVIDSYTYTGERVNTIDDLQSERFDVENTYQSDVYLKDTVRGREIVFQSRNENLIRKSQEIPTSTNAYHTVTPSRVIVSVNDTLYQGQAIAEKIVKASSSLAFVTHLLDYEYMQPYTYYTYAFDYATNSFDEFRLNVVGFGTVDEVIVPNQNEDWNTAYIRFYYTGPVSDEIQLQLISSTIGDSLYATNFRLQRSGSLNDTTSEYIYTDTEIATNALEVPIPDSLRFIGNLDVQGSITNVDSLKWIYENPAPGDTIQLSYNTFILPSGSGTIYLDDANITSDAQVKVSSNGTITLSKVGAVGSQFSEYGNAVANPTVTGQGITKTYIFLYDSDLYWLTDYQNVSPITSITNTTSHTVKLNDFISIDSDNTAAETTVALDATKLPIGGKFTVNIRDAETYNCIINANGNNLDFNGKQLSGDTIRFVGSASYTLDCIHFGSGNIGCYNKTDYNTNTGYEFIRDTTYTIGSGADSLEITAGDTVTLQLQDWLSVDSELPLDNGPFIIDSTIIADELYADYDIRVNVFARTATASTYFEVLVVAPSISGSEEIIARTQTFPKGTNTWVKQNLSIALFGGTIINEPMKIRITSPSTIFIAAPDLYFRKVKSAHGIRTTFAP